MADQPAFLAEIRRVLQPDARFALIVYCAAHPGDLNLRPPEGNTFPTVKVLQDLLGYTSLRVTNSSWIDDFAALPADWEEAMASVQATGTTPQ